MLNYRMAPPPREKTNTPHFFLCIFIGMPIYMLRGLKTVHLFICIMMLLPADCSDVPRRGSAVLSIYFEYIHLDQNYLYILKGIVHNASLTDC